MLGALMPSASLAGRRVVDVAAGRPSVKTHRKASSAGLAGEVACCTEGPTSALPAARRGPDLHARKRHFLMGSIPVLAAREALVADDLKMRRGLAVALVAVTLASDCRAETTATAACPLVKRPDAVIFDLRSALPEGQQAMVRICADGKCVGHAVDASQPASTKILSIFTKRRNSKSFTAAAGATRNGTALFSDSVTARLKETFPFGKDCGGVWRVTIVADRQGHLTTTDITPVTG